MGKRTSYDKIPRDFYSTTDPRAVAPLLPHLAPRTRFCEPAAGDLALVKQLEAAGHTPFWISDIMGRDVTAVVSGVPVTRTVIAIDALKLTTPMQQSDVVITNPPYSKEILFPLMEHFRKYKAAWLLLNADFIHNIGSAPYLEYCSMIVSVGRIKWIEGSKGGGMENHAWLKFEQQPCETRFIGRQTKLPAAP